MLLGDLWHTSSFFVFMALLNWYSGDYSRLGLVSHRFSKENLKIPGAVRDF